MYSICSTSQHTAQASPEITIEALEADIVTTLTAETDIRSMSTGIQLCNLNVSTWTAVNVILAATKTLMSIYVMKNVC